MKRLLVVFAALISVTPAIAGEATSAYTKIDSKHCRQIEKPDKFVFAGASRCKGIGGYDVFVSSADERDSAAFGTRFANNCAGLKTFNSFNSAGSVVEWRVRNGKPFAAILRWTVSTDPEDSTKQATWLVVHKLEAKDSCPMHYVNGSFPNANDVARQAADDKAASFVCETSTPTFDSSIGPPNITLEPCSGMGRE